MHEPDCHDDLTALDIRHLWRAALLFSVCVCGIGAAIWLIFE